MNPRGSKGCQDSDSKATGKNPRKRNSTGVADVDLSAEGDQHDWKRRMARKSSSSADEPSDPPPSADTSASKGNSVSKTSLDTDNFDDGTGSATILNEWMRVPVGPVRLSEKDRSAALTFVDGSDTRLTVRGHKGYRMVRATHGICEGDWFFEAEVCPYEGDGAVRLGWSTRRSDAETPVGFDGYGFAIRDRTGEFIHLAQRRGYGEPFGPGDVIGCRIRLPDASEQVKKSIAESDLRWLEYRFIHYLQGKPPPDTGLTVQNSFVEFYKNGKSFGIPTLFTREEEKLSDDRASLGMPVGMYFPSVAVYKNAIVHVNFGPTFKFAPPQNCQALSECAPNPVQLPPADDTACPGSQEKKLAPSDSTLEKNCQSPHEEEETNVQNNAGNNAETSDA